MKTLLFASLVLVVNLATAKDSTLSVPSDSRATYDLVELRKAGTKRTVVTKRVGPSGTSFAIREIDCKAQTFRYLGEGDTLAEAKRNKKSESMSPLSQGSISYHVALAACDS
ncbi:hypothetical protein DBA29_27025 [Xenophilus aerolatus]|nr:hypothetical protein [Xenophilus aerolatus]